jgi:hypothetical protein
MKIVLFVLSALVLLVASAPNPPTVSEVFTTNVAINIVDPRFNHTLSGKGVWASDQPKGKTVENYILDGNTEFHLLRFDLSTGYEQVDKHACRHFPLEGPMPPLWGWLATATASMVTINGKTYNAWSKTMGYATVSLVVDINNNPTWFERTSPQRNVTIQFLDWNTSPPAASVFNVPSQCANIDDETKQSLPGEVGCVSRTTMISRAQNWVNLRIPYSQSSTYEGYREDCSGYVSMAWEAAKPGYTTFTLHEISHPISKNDLQPGDILLCASEHVVIFGGWTSGAHSEYTAFEETRPGEGTVKRATPYPYWYNTGCFLPYRFNSVC